ncbi:MAG: hypothetical protein ABR94_01220 [Sphingobacteriales bacterium BACL12 MAG-120802-bin5]|jgi:hypothetical protein|nr:MAG: hypothetical protein ABR94_01220 [Sphingobacteriales bacterium BACL12 MAG-120802-bin5]
MKKLLWTICFVPGLLMGQHLGFNGAGFFENYDDNAAQWMQDLNGSFTLRVPGGAISKFHDPYNNRNGWGMSEESVSNWFSRDGFDEDGQGADKWLRKVKEQPNISYLEQLVTMQQQFPAMRVLYVLNVLNSTPEANMQAIRYLKEHGVQVTGVEAGNEIYGKYARFEDYIKDFEPIFNMLDAEFPEISKGLVAGANLSRKELVKWNNDLAAYKGDYDAVILHYYYTSRELGAAYKMIEKVKYDPEQNFKQLDKAFEKASELMQEEDLIGKGLAYAEQQFPGKKIWITEWNTKPSDKLNNTILNGGWQFEQMMRYGNRIEYFLMHNGISPDKYGMISRSNSKFDSEKTALVRRMGYWSMQLALATKNAQPLERGKQIQIPSGRESVYWFSNMDAAYPAEVQFNPDQFRSVTVHYVGGNHLYSGAGYTGFMEKGSTRSYEVSCVRECPFTGELPGNAYGYIVWTPR